MVDRELRLHILHQYLLKLLVKHRFDTLLVVVGCCEFQECLLIKFSHHPKSLSLQQISEFGMLVLILRRSSAAARSQWNQSLIHKEEVRGNVGQTDGRGLLHHRQIEAVLYF